LRRRFATSVQKRGIQDAGSIWIFSGYPSFRRSVRRGEIEASGDCARRSSDDEIRGRQSEEYPGEDSPASANDWCIRTDGACRAYETISSCGREAASRWVTARTTSATVILCMHT
jgi:hypothetical protein